MNPVPRPLVVGLVGCGVVGGGVVEALLAPSPALRRRDGSPLLRLKRVADLRWPKGGRLENGVVVPAAMRSKDFREIIDDPEIEIVVELIGGKTVARQVIESALDAGKSVVTANKSLLAECGEALFKRAGRRGCEIAFEAAVAGGIPILAAIRGGLAANRITTIYGILNGTTNFILTRMSEERLGFAEALAEAQRLGFAEADPTLDVEGIDAAHKIHLLAALALGRTAPMALIPVQGITAVSALDIAYAEELGRRIKLLALAKLTPDGVEISVSPSLVPAEHPLAAIRNETNAVFVEGDLVGPSLFVGKGAGRYPTASAVLADLLELADGGKRGYVPRMLDARRTRPVAPEKSRSGFYLRISAEDRPGVLGRVTGILGREGISIASCVQLGREAPKAPVPVALLTHETSSAAVLRAARAIDRLGCIKGRTVIFPVVA